MAVSRKTQRNGTFGRLTNVTADSGKTPGKQSTHPGDNLNSGNGSEEDGVENRSETQNWLTDSSSESTGSAQDVKPASGVKTAPPLFGADSQSAGSSTDTAVSSSGADPIDPIPASPADPPAWGESRMPTSGLPGNGSFRNGGSAAAGAGVGSAISGGRPSQSGQGSQTAPFVTPTKSRPKPQRPAKAPRPPKAPRTQTQQGQGPSIGGQRPAPAGFPAQGGPSSRKAQLAIARIEPWSVMKFSFMISLVGWVILFVAVALMYFVLQKIGVFTSIEHTVGLVTASKNRAGTNAASWFSASRVLGYTMLIGAVNVILITALATIGSVLYNLVTMLAGGIEVTLKETD
jgi:hypothetical protein